MPCGKNCPIWLRQTNVLVREGGKEEQREEGERGRKEGGTPHHIEEIISKINDLKYMVHSLKIKPNTLFVPLKKVEGKEGGTKKLGYYSWESHAQCFLRESANTVNQKGVASCREEFFSIFNGTEIDASQCQRYLPLETDRDGSINIR